MASNRVQHFWRHRQHGDRRPGAQERQSVRRRCQTQSLVMKRSESCRHQAAPQIDKRKQQQCRGHQRQECGTKSAPRARFVTTPLLCVGRGTPKWRTKNAGSQDRRSQEHVGLTHGKCGNKQHRERQKGACGGHPPRGDRHHGCSNQDGKYVGRQPGGTAEHIGRH